MTLTPGSTAATALRQPVGVPGDLVAAPERWVVRFAASGAGHLFITWGRVVISGIALAAQLVALALVIRYAVDATAWLLIAFELVSVAVLLGLLNGQMAMAYKLGWTLVLLLLPLIGAVFYLLFGSHRAGASQRRRHEASLVAARQALLLAPTVQPPEDDSQVARQMRHLKTAGGYPARPATGVRYYPTGAEGFEAILEAIAQAERYVYIEYFILARGWMWDQLFAALAERARAGVKVCVLYDDLGSFMRLPKGLWASCAQAGIEVRPVNPLRPALSLRANNRDHRKICAIDGTVAFTGGINIGDEYVGLDKPYGDWKDHAIRVEGPAAWSFTVMLAEQWGVMAERRVDYQALLPSTWPEPGEGVAIPFDDTPFVETSLGLATYRELLSTARSTVDIVTPYLVIDDFLHEVLAVTAQSGVRVRLVVPGTNDSWITDQVAKAAFARLIENGVEVYRYSPGFVHQKTMTADDDTAVVGTINFDYRSFYLHQECAVWLYGTPAIESVRADVELVISRSDRVTMAEATGANPLTRLVRALLGVAAPLI